MLSAVQSVSALFGRQGPKLPDWAISGAILGVQGGTEKMLKYVEEAEEAGVVIGGVWIQDWSGKINTEFGTRVFWNWKWNETMYPGLDQEIINLKARGIRVTGYINPYLNQEGDIFKEADALGYFLRAEEGGTFLQDFGEFTCGTIDFWNPDAYNWYKDLIKENLLKFGLAGWMADFGEYTPVEAYSSGGEGLNAMERHNLLPVLWAKMNRSDI
jgi:alpha-glucosidase